ncbi:SF-assemblin [Scenedesmus sp. PABB004]|nr:SF-assemblin [Scenedesmus sp. PABB004]
MPTSPHRIVTPMVAGRLSESPPGNRYTSPIRGLQQQALFKAGGPTAKLEHVAERFSAFYTDLEQEKQQKRMAESSRHQVMAEGIARLEKSFEAEVKRRSDSDRALQSHFEGEIKGLQEKLNASYAELSGAFKASLEGLARTVQDLHAIIKEEREQRRADIEHLAGSLVSKVNECVAAIDEERVARVEMETKTVRQVGQDLVRLQERLEGEKAARDGEVNALRGEVHEVLAARNAADERFQAVVLDEIAGLKSAVAAEREERVAEDDEIVAARARRCGSAGGGRGARARRAQVPPGGSVALTGGRGAWAAPRRGSSSSSSGGMSQPRRAAPAAAAISPAALVLAAGCVALAATGHVPQRDLAFSLAWPAYLAAASATRFAAAAAAARRAPRVAPLAAEAWVRSYAAVAGVLALLLPGGLAAAASVRGDQELLAALAPHLYLTAAQARRRKRRRQKRRRQQRKHPRARTLHAVAPPPRRRVPRMLRRRVGRAQRPAPAPRPRSGAAPAPSPAPRPAPRRRVAMLSSDTGAENDDQLVGERGEILQGKQEMKTPRPDEPSAGGDAERAAPEPASAGGDAEGSAPEPASAGGAPELARAGGDAEGSAPEAGGGREEEGAPGGASGAAEAEAAGQEERAPLQD